MKKWPESYVPSGAGMVASGLAAFVGLQAAVGWRQQRRRELEVSEHRHREDIYEKLITHMTESFVKDLSSGGPKASESLIRSQAALWGSKETIEALRSWHKHTYLIVTNYGGNLLDHPDAKLELWDRYAAVVTAIRKELSPSFRKDPLAKELILGMIFNDYPENAGKKIEPSPTKIGQ